MTRHRDERRNKPARRAGAGAPPGSDAHGERIAKVMARAGLCSRRDAEEWIAAGRVAVNGKPIASPAVNVSGRDRITVDGKPMPRRERTRLFLYNKPAGLVTTNADPQGRPTVFDALPKELPRLMSVGRLDIGTEGLLLLTNDGGLARVLELPDTQWLRRYRVRAHGRVTQTELDRLRDGISIEGVNYGPIEATLDREQGANVWLSFAIREGKNREVRNVLGHLGLQVNRLIRVAFGPFDLGELRDGATAEVETPALREQLGEAIADRAGCDFISPVVEREATPRSREQRREERRTPRGQDRWRGERESAPAAARQTLRPRLTPPPRPSAFHEEGEGKRADAPRGDKPFRRSRTPRDDRPERPPGRPRRGHAWRKDDAPLRRTYRGSRRDDLKIADEARPDKRAGLLKDRKGRRILVERFGTKKPKPEPAEQLRQRTPRPPPRDRSSGPRPSRPPRDPSSGARPSRPPRDPSSGPRPSRPPRDPSSGPRPSRPPRDPSSGPRPSRPPRDPSSGPRPSRPPRDSSSGPRPSRPRTRPDRDR
jgi:23S rRNA pseudouridine2605 synthase